MSDSIVARMPLIAVIVPVFNEAVRITENLRAISAVLDSMPAHRFRIVVVDDGSTDDTQEKLKALQRDDRRVHALGFTRNFGKESAILAGLRAVNDADAAIVMDSDLQHPPSLIPDMLALWDRGLPVVEAVKVDRGTEAWARNLSARAFYRLFAVFSGFDLAGKTDFKLLDRRVIDAYVALPERERFFRGLVSWLGFAAAQLPFAVPDRGLGNTRWTPWKLWRYALSAITSFSARPLQIITFLGVLTLGLSVIIGLKALVDRISGVAIQGFTTVILLQLFLGGALMISLGLLGMYMARLHEELKARPSYIIGWQGEPDDSRDGDPSREARLDQ
jgi:polyisoprenyl-phosphate glycosyltransferase